MKQLLISIFMLTYLVSCNCQETDYRLYHQNINKAELLYFIDNEVDSCIYFYNQAFDNYDFIFLKDLVNAAQISYYNGKPYKQYLIKGFQYGLKFEHLKNIKLFQPTINELLSDVELQRSFYVERKKYLQKINFEYLLKIYDLCIQDQIDKSKDDEISDNIKKIQIARLKNWINDYGFPGSKNIGIDDKGIFSEIGQSYNDIDNRKLKFSNKLDYYTAEDNALSSTFIIILLVHNHCTFIELDSVLYKSVLKGEIHPREVGLLYDNMFRRVNSNFYQCNIPSPNEGLFYLNKFCKYSNSNLECTEEQSNSLRSKWYIVSREVDRMKKKFEKEHRFKLFYGFWKCM